MRNYIATCVIAAASLASCTQTEDFTSQYNEKAKTMKFDVAYVGKNTRAATGNMTTDKLNSKKITIWGAAYPTSDVTNGGLWITEKEPLTLEKSSTSYWYAKVDDKDTEVKYPGSTYTTYFTAIAPADEFQATDGTGTQPKYSMAGQYTDGSSAPKSNTRRLTLSDIPVVQEAPSTLENTDATTGTDYLVACATSTTEEVSLTFKHILSRLKFAVWTDESTANGENPTTQIVLNKIVFYLPGTNAKATYVQSDHNVVAGNWTWSGFTNTSTAPTESTLGDYQKAELITSGTKEVKYYSGPTIAHAASWDEVKLTDQDKTYFIAPNGSTSCKLYMDIEYTVKRKLTGGDWSSSSTKGDSGYSAGHKVVTRTGMVVPVGDDSYGHGKTDSDEAAERNEGLSHFHQGVNEILYICLRADQKVAFSTSFTVADWVEDPIDASKNQ